MERLRGNVASSSCDCEGVEIADRRFFEYVNGVLGISVEYSWLHIVDCIAMMNIVIDLEELM